MYTFDDLVAGFRTIPLTPSKVIIVHSSYKALGKIEGGAETVLDALLEYVGPEGTILLPNFNFQAWTENHYFDVLETPSNMGIIGELARLRPDALRTPHPIYSFAALGARKEEFITCDDEEAFGPNSVFARFHQLNGMLISINLDWNSTYSIVHYVEFNVGIDHRRIKRFSGIYVGYDGQPQIKTYTMFVRKERSLTDVVPATDELFEMGVIKATQIGDATVHYTTANDYFDNLSEIVRAYPEKMYKIIPPKY